MVRSTKYLEIRKYPIPTQGKLITHYVSALASCVGQKKAAIVTIAYTTRDLVTGEDVFYNESSSYIRDVGNFGGCSNAASEGNSDAMPAPPPFIAACSTKY